MARQQGKRSGPASSSQDEPVIVSDHPVGEEETGAGRRVAALVTLNRPDQLNPIDWSMLRALDEILDGLAARTDLASVLITGAGRAFSAGGDLESYLTLQRDPVAFPKFVADIHRVFGRLRQLPVPVVALVNGVTAAGGLELLLNCDLAYVADDARIGDGHLNFGQMGGGGVLTLLSRTVGVQRACELIFTGRFLAPAEAVAYGLAVGAVPPGRLLDAGLEFATAVAAKSPLAVANAKHVLHQLWCSNGDVESGLRFERERNAFYCLTSADAREGLEAFAAKRKPRFEGR